MQSNLMKIHAYIAQAITLCTWKIRHDGCQSMVILPGPPLSELYSGLDRLKPNISVILYVFGGSASAAAFLNSAEWFPLKTCTLSVLLWGASNFMYWSKNAMNSSFFSSLRRATWQMLFEVSTSCWQLIFNLLIFCSLWILTVIEFWENFSIRTAFLFNHNLFAWCNVLLQW